MNEPNERPTRPRSLRTILLIAGAVLVIVLAWLGYNAFQGGAETGSAPEAGSTPGNGLQVNVQDGDIFNDPILTLTGSGAPDQLIFINGQPVPVLESGQFELTLQLTEGPNLILVETRDAGGRVTSLARQVVYQPEGAAPVETEPAEAPAAGPTTGLLAGALGLLMLAVIFVLLRRRRPWINLTTESEQIVRGIGDETFTIVLELDRTTRLSLFVLDAGRTVVTTLLNNRRRQGKRHIFTWNGTVEGQPVAAGTYTIRAVAGSVPSRAVAEVKVEIRASV